MIERDVDVLILGAGPGGLAAACKLAEAGRRTLVVERANCPGGLMQSIYHGDFIVDLGRKELLTNVPEVDKLWSRVLGDDYRPYPRRCGVLYRKKIYETERQHKGIRYGMSWLEFSSSILGLLQSKILRPTVTTYESQVHRRLGQKIAATFYQAYDEKISGVRWQDRAPQQVDLTKKTTSTFGKLLRRAFAAKPMQIEWKHPAKGSGQICNALHEHAQKWGAEFMFDAQLKSVNHSNNQIESAVIESGDQSFNVRSKVVVASPPVEVVSKVLGLPVEQQNHDKKAPEARSTICVYLFLNEAPRFPHSWLKVTCPDMKAARITNYATFSSDMVPASKSCFCVEFCCIGPDPLLQETDAALQELAATELAACGLINRAAIFDCLIRRLPGVDGATDLSDWWTKARRESLYRLRQFENLYCICQPGTHYASWSGLTAADSILSNDRTKFDHRMDPETLFGSI
jgi:protoporphyrinogen oxidase